MTNDYITFKLSGFKNYLLDKDDSYCFNNAIIEKVTLKKDLSEITLFLKEGLFLKDNESEINNFMDNFIFKLIFNTNIQKFKPKYAITSTFTSDENVPEVTINNMLVLKSKCKVSFIAKADDFFNETFGKSSLILSNKNRNLFKTILSILYVDDLTLQFLLCYELLMDVLAKNKHKKVQKNVITFVKSYRKKFDIKWISFKETRKVNKSYLEDNFTYLRNLISHADLSGNEKDYKEIQNKVTNKIISQLLRLILEAQDDVTN